MSKHKPESDFVWSKPELVCTKSSYGCKCTPMLPIQGHPKVWRTRGTFGQGPRIISKYKPNPQFFWSKSRTLLCVSIPRYNIDICPLQYSSIKIDNIIDSTQISKPELQRSKPSYQDLTSIVKENPDKVKNLQPAQ